MGPLRWGICGAGKICSDFVNALSVLPPENHKILAVSARDAERAQQFAEANNIPKYYSNYASLFSDKDVDVVYVGIINSAHKAAVIGALEAGKHVLCEKVMGLNAIETAQMTEKAKERGLFLMEGYWTRFFPAIIKVREELKSGVIGEPKIFNANFGYQLAGDAAAVKWGGGATIGIGCYLTMLAQFAFFCNSEVERPLKIVANGTLNELGFDKTVTVTIYYSNDRLATFIYTIEMGLVHDAFIAGTNGIIKIQEPCRCSTTVITPTGKYDFPLPKSDHKFIFPNGVGLSYEAEHVRQCLLKGYRESPVMTLKESIILAEITDEIQRQVGSRMP